MNTINSIVACVLISTVVLYHICQYLSFGPSDLDSDHKLLFQNDIIHVHNYA